MPRAIQERVQSWNLGVEDIERYRFASRFVADKRVLDFACGTGYGSQLLHTEGRASLVYGIDVSAEAIEAAQRFAVPGLVQFVAGEAGALPIEDAFFDVAVSMETLEHLADVQAYLQDLRRVLTPDGMAIISTPRNEDSSRTRPGNPFHRREYSSAEFLDLLQKVFPNVEIWSQLTDYRDDMDPENGLISRGVGLLRGLARHGLPVSMRRGLRRALKSEGLVAQTSSIIPGVHSLAAYQIALCRGPAVQTSAPPAPGD